MKVTKLILICFLSLLLIACSNKTFKNKTFKEEDNIYNLNDIIKLSNSDGIMNLKFISVTETEERNPYHSENYDRVIVIEYEYENIDIDYDVYINEYNFKIYDKDNTILKTYPLITTEALGIAKGRNAKNKIAYGLNNDNNYIEIELLTQTDNKHLNKTVVLEW